MWDSGDKLRVDNLPHSGNCPELRGYQHMIEKLIAALLLVVVASTAGARQPLEPVDTSSPRATVQSFLTLTEEAAGIYNAYRDTPNPET